jgi:hypothetical protein
LALAKAGDIWRLLEPSFESWEAYVSDVAAKQMSFALHSSMRVPLVKFLTLQGLAAPACSDSAPLRAMGDSGALPSSASRALCIALAKAAGKYKGRKASLTDGQASELRARLAGGESITALAKEYGVSRQTVYNYKTG